MSDRVQALRTGIAKAVKERTGLNLTDWYIQGIVICVMGELVSQEVYLKEGDKFVPLEIK